MSDFLSCLVQRTLEQAPVMRPLILPWVNSTPMSAGETRHESIQEGSDEQITMSPVMPDLNSPSQQPAPSLISTATERRSPPHQQVNANKLTSSPRQDIPVREKNRTKRDSESPRRQYVEAPVQPDAQETTQSLPSSNRERAREKAISGKEAPSLFPLPWREGVRGRGKSSVSGIAFTPSLTLPHQGGGDNIYRKLPKASPEVSNNLSGKPPHPGPLPPAEKGVLRESFSPHLDRSPDQAEKVSHPPQKPPPATPGQSRPTPIIANTVQGENFAKSRAEPARAHTVSPRAQPVVPQEQQREPSRRETPPTIQVTIGRIEVRAVTPPSRPKPTRQPVRPREPGLSLDDYLKRRGRSR